MFKKKSNYRRSYARVKLYAGLHTVVKAFCYITYLERTQKCSEQIRDTVHNRQPSSLSWPKFVLNRD